MHTLMYLYSYTYYSDKHMTRAVVIKYNENCFSIVTPAKLVVVVV